MYLALMPDAISLHIERDDPRSRGLLEKIKEFLDKHRRKSTWFAKNAWIGAIIVGLSFYFFLSRSLMKALIGCVLLFLGGFWLWWGYNVIGKKWSVIHLRRRIDSPFFWKRNKDAIVVAIISVIAGSLITLLITNLLKLLKKP